MANSGFNTFTTLNVDVNGCFTTISIVGAGDVFDIDILNTGFKGTVFDQINTGYVTEELKCNLCVNFIPQQSRFALRGDFSERASSVGRK